MTAPRGHPLRFEAAAVPEHPPAGCRACTGSLRCLNGEYGEPYAERAKRMAQARAMHTAHTTPRTVLNACRI